MNALLVLMVAFWSGNYIAGKIALREFPPLLLVGVRLALAGVVMLPIYLGQRFSGAGVGAGREALTGANRLRLLALGLFGVTLNQLFFIIGLSRTSVAHASILIALTPILVLILAGLRGLERISAAKIAGMLMAFAGIAILKTLDPAGGSRATWLGDFCIFLTALCFAIYTVAGKETTKLYSSVTVNTYAYVGGALAMAPVNLWEAARHPLARLSPSAWLAAIYMALFPSVIAYLIYYYALSRIDASRVAAFSYLQPVMATAMGATILGERITPPVVAGGLVILTGVYLAERS